MRMRIEDFQCSTKVYGNNRRLEKISRKDAKAAKNSTVNYNETG